MIIIIVGYSRWNSRNLRNFLSCMQLLSPSSLKAPSAVLGRTAISLQTTIRENVTLYTLRTTESDKIPESGIPHPSSVNRAKESATHAEARHHFTVLPHVPKRLWQTFSVSIRHPQRCGTDRKVRLCHTAIFFLLIMVTFERYFSRLHIQSNFVKEILLQI